MSALDEGAIGSWLADRIGVVLPLTFVQVAGGKSNLTYIVIDATGRKVVLRRPPFGHVLATAHDVGREHRIMSALSGTPVPVPEQLAWCDDPAVTDAPFFVMAFVDGAVVRTAADADARLPVADRVMASEALVDTLVAIHQVDVDAVGLGDLGKRTGYVARQLKRWRGQFEQSREVTGVPLALADEVHDRLVASMPDDHEATLVHGDYRFDNVLLGPGGSVDAVLDWELCTLGDPLADVGLLLVYWNDPGDTTQSLAGSGATAAAGFPRKTDLREMYAEKSTRDLSHLDFYVAFGYWKLACILDGVYTRYAKGAMGSDGASWEAFGQSVVHLAEASKAAAGSLT